MSCAACVSRVERALRKVPGVHDASVNLASGVATIESDTPVSGALISALKGIGYPARQNDILLRVGGLNCAACVRRAETTLMGMPGVVSASVNLAVGTARVGVVEGTTSPSELAQALSATGYPTKAQSAGSPQGVERAAAQEQAARRLALISAALTLPVFVTEMGGHLVPAFHHLLMGLVGSQVLWGIQFVLTSLVLIWPGRRFFSVGVPALLKGTPEMNSLVALGAFAAWAYSCVVLFVPGMLPDPARAVYFEASAVIVTLILVGRWLEARAKGRAGSAIQALIGLQPKTVRVEREGQVSERALDEIVTGDLLHIRPGEKIAVDGQVVSGHSYLDEAMISGEAHPVAKAAGDAVIGGTLNGQGALVVKATNVGRDTVLAQIIQMVETAQAAKLPVQALADRVVAVFVPSVLIIALMTVAFWLAFGPVPEVPHALVAGVSVLIIACPCAMGLATPTSIMVGTGRAAELGVFFRQGEALQRLTDARVVAFDKTGTLTDGRMSVVQLYLTSGFHEADVMPLVAALEAKSEHPVAQALVAHWAGDLLAVTGCEARPGRGVQGQVDGRQILAGNARLMQDHGVDISAFEQHSSEAGGSLVYVAINGQSAAVFVVADRVKPSGHDVIAQLHTMGLTTAMISGDSPEAAGVVAQELGIPHVEAGVLPEGKAKVLAHLRETYGPVVFVGDGINDAPALASADVGIAVGTGTDVSIETADVVLMSGDLKGVLAALHMSRATLRNIRQNLFWAFAYNVALIPVAAGLLYPLTGTMLSPMLAAGAMALSSVFVIFNALRLRRVNP